MTGLAFFVLLFVVATVWWLFGPRSPFPWGPKIKVRRKSSESKGEAIVEDWNSYLNRMDGRRYP